MDFADFYGATSPRLLRYAYGLTGDLPLAQDVTQEAYARAWQRWRSVSRHNDVEAWLRVVVTRLVYDWWRRLGVHRNRMEQPQTVPPPSEDAVLLSVALKQLPRAQAQALALHYLLDLPISQIAAETGVAEGTVKSWLSRGRAGLADLLREEPVPGVLATAADVQDRGARRRRTRVIVAVVIGLALVAGLAVWRAGPGRHAQPVTPSPSPAVPHQTMQRLFDLNTSPLAEVAPRVVVAGGRGIVAQTRLDVTQGNSAAVTAIDLASGQKLWTATVQSTADQFYVESNVVVVEGFETHIGGGRTNELTALGSDGQVLWHTSKTVNMQIFPFSTMLVEWDGDLALAGLDWRTGQPAWHRQGLTWQMTVMHSVADGRSEQAPLAGLWPGSVSLAESGKLLAIEPHGKVVEVDVATGRDIRSWISGKPFDGAFRSFSAYEGKLYFVGDNRLRTVDLGGKGPVVDYTAPDGSDIIKAPAVPCLRIFICLTAGRSLHIVGGHELVFELKETSSHPPTAVGDSLMVALQSELGEFETVHRDPAGMWHTSQHTGIPLWMNAEHLLIVRIDKDMIVDLDLETGAEATLGRLNLGGYGTMAATDGRTLIAATAQGKVAVYRIAARAPASPTVLVPSAR
jgi:RNA polymerase sigma factor (sigma-70 family)